MCYIVNVGDDMKEEQKKLILSVVGILVLIVAVFGITYAFYQYMRIGSNDNSITSGKLFVEFEENTSYINITDIYPMDNAEALQTYPEFVFYVRGYIEGANSVTYNVYGVQGDTYQERDRLKDYEVNIKLTGSNDQNVPNSISINNSYDNTHGSVIGNDGVLKVYDGNYEDDLILASGIISSNDAGVTETHTYRLKMWISDQIVTVGGLTTETTGDTVGSTTRYTSDDFENLYYSMKINVVAKNGALMEQN